MDHLYQCGMKKERSPLNAECNWSEFMSEFFLLSGVTLYMQPGSWLYQYEIINSKIQTKNMYRRFNVSKECISFIHVINEDKIPEAKMRVKVGLQLDMQN